MRAAGLFVSCILVARLSAPAGSAQPQPVEKTHVIVSILPQAYFVERVGGEFVDVEVLVGPGQSPHTYEPTPKQLAALSRAKLYFRIGIDCENSLVPRIEQVFKDIRIVDLRRRVPLRTLTASELEADKDHAAHEHGEAGEKQPAESPAGRPDPHIWLNPLLVKIQAQTICDALTEIDPAHAAQYRQNLSVFRADLDRVHATIRESLAPLKGAQVFVYHPAFGYFTDAYELQQVPVEIDGREPAAKQLTELIERAKAAGVRVIFVQPQFSKKSAEAVAQAIGGAVVPLDDLSRDYLKNLEDIAAKIKAALAKPSQQGTPVDH